MLPGLADGSMVNLRASLNAPLAYRSPSTSSYLDSSSFPSPSLGPLFQETASQTDDDICKLHLDKNDLSTIQDDVGEVDGPVSHDDDEAIQAINASLSNLDIRGKSPLVGDLYQEIYESETLPTAELEKPSLPIHPLELSHLIRVQKYHKIRQTKAESRLQAWQVSAGLFARLSRSGRSAYQSLVESFRFDDKRTFVQTFNTLHDVRASFEASWASNLQGTDVNSDSLGHSSQDPSKSLSFFHQLSSESRSSIFGLLHYIRNDSDFLADRIASLSSSQFSSFVASCQSLDTFGSALSQHSNRRFPGANSKRSSAHIASAPDSLLSLERHDPFSALLFNVFGNSWDPYSPEHGRRTEVWSNVCARLVREGRTGSGEFVASVLNAWAFVQSWPLMNTFELYLTETLHDGAFLLETLDDSSSKTEPAPDTPERVENFFHNAVSRLFVLLDDDLIDYGLPSGIMTFAKTILGKLRDEKKQLFRNFVLAQWFISRCLRNTLLYPETQALMMEYYISSQMREKILREVGNRARQQVLNAIYSMGQSVTPIPEVSVYIDHFFACLDSDDSPDIVQCPTLIPPELGDLTFADEHDCLLLSVPDLLAIINAIFPERPQRSFIPDNLGRRRNSSSRNSSVIGLPITISSASSHPYDSLSIRSSNSFSLTGSDTSQSPPDPVMMSVENLFQQNDGLTLSLQEADERNARIEDLERKLKIARAELSSVFGFDRPVGTPDPSSENWVILSISPDGKELTLEPHNDIHADTRDNLVRATGRLRPQWHNTNLPEEYKEIKATIIQLLEDMEPSRLTNLQELAGKHSDSTNVEAFCIENMLQEALNQAQIESDYVDMQYWWNLLETFQKTCKSVVIDGNFSFFTEISNTAEIEMEHSLQAISNCEDKFAYLKLLQKRQDSSLKALKEDVEKLRDKMWYTSDVRNSSKYEEARNVGIALRSMAKSGIKHPRNSFISAARSRNMPRALAGSFLLKTENQTVSIMTAPRDQGGSTKLADVQVEMTANWMSQSRVENFCKGEERIHRFCLEVQKCVSKIVGTDILAGPELWSSELYQLEKRYFASSKRQKEVPISSAARPSSGSSSDEGSMWSHSRSGLRNMGLAPRSSISNHDSFLERCGLSQSGFSSRSSLARDSILGGSTCRSDRSARTLSTISTDSSNTFWSPAATPLNAPTEASSIHSRPGTFYDVQLSNMSSEPKVTKDDFLNRMKERLTSLLLSDLGYTVWNQGSETDKWFFSIGAECVSYSQQKKEAAQEVKSLKKKASSQSLREISSTSRLDSRERAVNRRRSRSLGPQPKIARETSEGTESDSVLKNGGSAKDDTTTTHALPPFPSDKAFRALFEKFSSQPNPWVKLNAVYDIKRLIVALLRTGQLTSIKPCPTFSVDGTPSTNPNNSDRVPTSSKDQHPKTSDSRSTVSPPTSSKTCVFPTISRIRHRSHQNPDREVVDAFKTLLQNNLFCPRTLFRDLQFISSFIPVSTLEKTDQGRAFWDLGLAALSWKQDVCNILTEVAAEVVTYEIEKGRKQTTHSYVPDVNSSSHRFTMEDAGHLLILAAREAHPVAQRELAIFYLTHPDLLPRVTLPLSLPREVFKAEAMTRANEDSRRFDPQVMCLAYHWMSESAKGGDPLAMNYVKEREEFDSIL